MTSRIRCWLPLLTTVGAVGCASYDAMSNEEYAAALKNIPASNLSEAVIRGNKAADPPAAHDEQNVGAAAAKQELYDDGTTWDCKVQRVSLQSNPEEFLTLDPMSGVYPGALLQGKSLSSVPEPIIAKRGPGTITLATVVGSSGTKSVDVPEVSLASAVTAQSKILEDLQASNLAIPAQISQKVEIFESLEEFAIKAKISQSFAFAKFNGSVSSSKQSRKSRILAQVTQTYFNINYERKTLDLGAVFAPEVTPSSLTTQIGPGNPATYVSQVTYGRIAYLMVESASSKSSLKAAVEATWGTGTGSVDVEAKSAANSATVSVIGLGGNISYLQSAAAQASTNGSAKMSAVAVAEALPATNDAEKQARDLAIAEAEALPTPLDAVKDFLKSDSATHYNKENPPSPIAYTVRNLVDNTVVKNGLNTEYEKKSCIPVVKSDRLQMSLDGANLKLGADSRGVTDWGGKPAVSAWNGSTTPQNSSNDVYGVVKTELNGHPAAGFFYADSGVRGLSCNFALGNSYTMVFVASPDFSHTEHKQQQFGSMGQLTTLLASEFTGSFGSPVTNTWLHAGWTGNSYFRFGAFQSDRQFSLAQQSNGHVIVLSHQTGVGKSAWSNGQPLGQNGADIGKASDALSGTSSCAIGSIEDRTVRYTDPGYAGYAAFMGVVGEVRGYKGALSTAERRVVECELSKKWSGSQQLVANCTDGKPNETY